MAPSAGPERYVTHDYPNAWSGVAEMTPHVQEIMCGGPGSLHWDTSSLRMEGALACKPSPLPPLRLQPSPTKPHATFRVPLWPGHNGLFDNGERQEQDTKNVTHPQLGRRPLVTLC